MGGNLVRLNFSTLNHSTTHVTNRLIQMALKPLLETTGKVDVPTRVEEGKNNMLVSNGLPVSQDKISYFSSYDNQCNFY